MTVRDTERVERTIATVGPASTALLHGKAGGLELLERHFAVLRIEKDIPVLIAHGVWLADVIAVLRWM